MFEITDTRQSPYASICYIRCHWPDGSATRASGVVVGLNDVLTALHAVFDEERGGFAEFITIYPGADTSPFFYEPFGGFNQVGSIAPRAANWDFDGDGLLTPQESQVDLALIGLATRIGDASGWLPVTQLASDFSGMAVGYPARGSGQMAENVAADASAWYGVYELDTGLGAGASGGPLLYTAGGVTSVVGVLSAGDANESTSTYAALYGSGTWDWLRGAMDANDTLLGLPPGAAADTSPNIYMGTSAADAFVGSAGRDVFTGLMGNDSFNGSDGLDAAVFRGPRANFDVSVIASNQVRVSDTMASRDGADTLTNVERIRFDDYSIAFDVQGTAGQAYRLYKAAFDRAPDLPGLGYQINGLDSGLPLWHVAGHFIESPEFQATYGNVDNQQFVTLLYRNVLDREPEAAGLQYHMNRLSNGTSRADVLVGFSESPENQANVIGAISAGMLYDPV